MKRNLIESIVAPLLSITLALAAGALLIFLAGKNPLAIYAQLAGGTFGSWYGIGQTLSKATPLLFTGLAVAVSFRAGVFNIGAEGQMIAGGFAGALAGIAVGGAPRVIALPLTIAAAAIAGGLVGWIAGWLRAERGVHEVISTIMLNFIATAAVGAMLGAVAAEGTVRTEMIGEGAWLPRLSVMFEGFKGSPVSAAFFLALGAAVLVWWLLWRSVLGYEIRVVGASPAAGRVAGIEVGRAIRRTFAISGALAGCASLGFVLGNKHYYETGFTAGAGFMGIAVALVGRNHPVGVVLAALLFGALSHGGLVVNAEISAEIVNVLQALIILFLIASLPAFRAIARRAA
jgi:simple sugar transport system permease protein